MDFWGKITACNREKEEEEKEKQQQPPTSDRLFSFSFSSSSPASYHHHQQQLQQQQQQTFFPPPPYHHHNEVGEPSTNYEEEGGGGGGSGIGIMMVEREHMFDKVVTPSDVGKLNRLVIPKQHAERFFPLDSSNNDKGLQLNFEDRNGKVWRFRYSYWNSSQSYVMTKGWSRFVKEKKLDAGDIVSFQRGVGITPKDRLFIDWRRRISHGVSSLPPSFSFHPWNPLVLKSHPAFPRRNNLMLPPSDSGMGNTTGGGPRSVIYFRPPPESTSTPPVCVSGKRLRLFGVNMDCPFSDEQELINRPSSSSSPPGSSNIPYQQLSPYGEASSADHAFDIIGKSTGSSMSLDLEI